MQHNAYRSISQKVVLIRFLNHHFHLITTVNVPVGAERNPRFDRDFGITFNQLYTLR